MQVLKRGGGLKNTWGQVLYPKNWILTSVWESVWLPPSHSAPEELVEFFVFSPH